MKFKDFKDRITPLIEPDKEYGYRCFGLHCKHCIFISGEHNNVCTGHPNHYNWKAIKDAKIADDKEVTLKLLKPYKR